MSNASASTPIKGSFLTSARTRMIAIVSALVILSLLGGGAVALWNVNKLSRDASTEIESGLTRANEEYLTRYIDMTAQRATLMFNRTFDQVTALAKLSQSLIDNPQLNKDLNSFLEQYPGFGDEMAFNRDANWLQNTRGEPSVISVWRRRFSSSSDGSSDCITRRTASFRNRLEAAPRQRWSEGGKCWPMSPSPRAPRMASVRACRATSASEWPLRRWLCGMNTPPSVTPSPGSSTWTS